MNCMQAGFWFWMGKFMADVVIGAGMLFVIGIICAIVIWVQSGDEKKK